MVDVTFFDPCSGKIYSLTREFFPHLPEGIIPFLPTFTYDKIKKCKKCFGRAWSFRIRSGLTKGQFQLCSCCIKYVDVASFKDHVELRNKFYHRLHTQLVGEQQKTP